MNKIFYNPETLKIVGMSDGEKSMEFPYIETSEKLHSLSNLKITKKNKKFNIEHIDSTLKIEKYCGRMRTYQRIKN